MSDKIEHRHLRSAIEFAVLIAAEGQKRRPPLPFPKELKPLLGVPRVPAASLGRLRRAIESDAGFRAAISAGALPDLVDEVGRLWLAGRPGWEAQAATLVEAAREESVAHDLSRDLGRAEKRRAAAEKAAARLQLELLQRDADLETERNLADLVRADLAKAEDAVAELRAELVDTRNEIRHARDREAAAVRRAEAAEAAAGAAASTASTATPIVVDAEPDPDVGAGPAVRIDPDELAAMTTTAQRLADQLAALQPPPDRVTRNPAGDRARDAGPRRRPVALPGGVIGTSGEAAAFLVRSGAAFIVDGYNVAKLAWPDRTLEQQRDALVARVEDLARRHSLDATVVFDGATVVGAHAVAPRRMIRVVYSPVGVTADDVIRSEVDRLPHDRAVVVVTNDRAIVRDVRAAGANVVPSNAFIAAL